MPQKPPDDLPEQPTHAAPASPYDPAPLTDAEYEAALEAFVDDYAKLVADLYLAGKLDWLFFTSDSQN